MDPRPPDVPPELPSRSELKLLRQAANEGWDVPGEIKNEALYQCWRIILDPTAASKNKLASARVLVAADRADIARARLRWDIERQQPAASEDDCRDLIEQALSHVENRDKDNPGRLP